MASLGTVSWGSSPVISIVFTYDYNRSGANMVYNVHVSVQPVTGAKYFGYPIYVEVKMDGSAHGSGTIKSASPSQWSSAINWSTGNQTISNKTSGSTSLSIRVYSGSGSSRNTTYSYNMAVSPAGSTLTASNGTLGTAQTITINKQNASFTDTVTYTCGSQSGTIVTDTLSGSVSWTPPISLASEVTDSTSVPVTLTTTTKSGGTTIQSNSTTITCAIPASIKPSCTVAISDPTGYATTYGAYVQTKSTLQSVITATTSYGSPINTYSTVADGNTYTTQTTITPVLQNTGAQNVVATVTDKRGRTSDAATAAYSVLAYAQPTLSSCTIQRGDADGTPNAEGHYMVIDFTGVITALNNINSATWAIRYRVAGSGTWTDVALPSLTGNYTPTHQEVIAAADADAFEVEVRATDDFGTTTVGTGSIPIAFTIMNWRTEGDGMAVGGINTKTGFQMYMDSEFTGDADFQGDVNVVDIDASSDYKLNGSSIFPISVQNGGTGAKNQAFIYSRINPGTSNGITWTVDHENQTITLNGTATSDVWVGYIGSLSGDYGGPDAIPMRGKDYTLSIIPANTGVQAFAAFYTGASGTGTYADIKLDIDDSYTFTVPANATRNRSGLHVTSGTTVNNVAYKLQFQEASIPDTSYTEPALTNQQLSNSFIVKRFDKTYTIGGSTSVGFDASFITPPNGYVLIGFVGWSTNNGNVIPRSVRYNGDFAYQYSFELRNLSSSSATNTFTVYALFAKSGMLTLDIS